MNYVTCKKIHESFVLDEKFEAYLAVREGVGDAIIKKVLVENPLEKGYVYANLYFYDEVWREVGKLHKMIKKIYDEISMEAVIEDPSKLLMEISTRVRNAIGDDSLDAFIKEILANEARAISLLPDEQELAKLALVKESIYTEVFNNFTAMTLRNATDVGEAKTFKFTDDYIDSLTERQKKLISPTLKVVGFINSVKLDEFELFPDWTVQYKPVQLKENFDAKEEEIKVSLKKLMEQYI